MNKDIWKYVANYILCRWDKAKVQQYPLQMTEIPDKPFDKIAIGLVTDCKTSTSGNKHILTIIDHLKGKLHLETHRLGLAIAKKTLNENRFTATQKTLARDNPPFQVGDHVYFKNKQPGKWDLKWRPRYQIVCIECNGHFIHIENQATGKTQSCNITDIILEPPIEFWNIDTQFGRASRYINHPANLPTIQLAGTS